MLKEKKERKKYLAFGEEKTLVDWSKDERCEVCYSSLYTRFKQRGWILEDALQINPEAYRIKYVAFGESKTLIEWAKDKRSLVTFKLLYSRVKISKWELERSLLTEPCDHSDDLEGKKFGDWTVIRKIRKGKHNQVYWLCRCICGKEGRVHKTNLQNGGSVCCGCKKTVLPDDLAAKQLVFNSSQWSARTRNIEWDLDENHFYSLIVENCFYCDQEPTQTRKRYPTFKYNGVDRIDSSGGYNISNVVPCCKRCNFIKMDMVSNDFLKHIEKLFLNLYNKKMIESKNYEIKFLTFEDCGMEDVLKLA